MKLLKKLDEERKKFTKANPKLIKQMVGELIKLGIYPEKSKIGRDALEMVENYGADWYEYRQPHNCLKCGEDLRDLKNGPPYKKEIGVIENDRLQYFKCPSCKNKF